MVTWNVATAEPPDDITSLLQLNSPKKADLYVIGSVLIGLCNFHISDIIKSDEYAFHFKAFNAYAGYNSETTGPVCFSWFILYVMASLTRNVPSGSRHRVHAKTAKSSDWIDV